jgi:hypothetical protein
MDFDSWIQGAFERTVAARKGIGNLFFSAWEPAKAFFCPVVETNCFCEYIYR